MTSPEPAPPKKPRRRVLSRRKKLAFAAATILLGLLVIELGLQIAGYPKGFLKSTKKMWATDEERALGPFRPGVEATITWPPELEYTAHINELGLRGAEPEPGKRLILCVGDSTTFGSHVAEDETYPYLLQQELRRRGRDVSVLNAGVPRWTVTDENEFLEAACEQLEVQAVVLLFCGNDLGELDKDPARQRALRSRSTLSDLRGKLAIPEAFLLLSLEARRSWLESQGRWPQQMRADQGRTAGLADAYWTRYGEGLNRTGELARAEKARFLVAPFPGYLEVEEDETCEVERKLPGLARAAGAEYVDLYPAFRASPQDRFLLPHDAHASEHGNALIASRIADALEAGWGRTK